MERHQVAIYLAAIAVGGLVGWAAPGAGPGLEHAINPVLETLLFVTFLQVPAGDLVRSLRAGRFLGAALTVNFAVVPLVIAAMVPVLPDDRALRLGVLLVLLCPCVDYVIVFSGLAGARNRQLLAATPLLLVTQILVLPVFLWLFLGSGLADVIDAGPFLEAFALLIVVPLALAWSVQALAAQDQARWDLRTGRAGRVGRVGRAVQVASGWAMVPLMIATLLTVVASQVPRLHGNLGDLARVAPVYAAFLLVMAFAGRAVARLFHLDVPAARAIVFTGATRNSLVVLPLALSLPDRFAVAPVAVVTQTLVEVVGMVVYVRAVPRLLPTGPPTTEPPHACPT
jgi:ACR3 family arsenite transporter